MPTLRRLVRSRRVVTSACAALAITFFAPGVSNARTVATPQNVAQRFRSDRLAAMRTLRARRHVTQNAVAVLRPASATPLYKIVNLHHVLGTPLGGYYPTVAAINQNGRILLSGIDDFSAPVPNYIVNEDGSHTALATGCPACDAGPSSAVALALDDGPDVVGYWHDYGGTATGGQYTGIEWRTPSEATSVVAGISAQNNGFALEQAVDDGGVAVGVAGSPNGGGDATAAFNFNTGFLGLTGPANACNASQFEVSSATAIDAAGIVVGEALSQANCDVELAVSFPAQGPAVPLPVVSPSIAVAINSGGVVAGIANERLTAFGYSPGARAFLYPLGNTSPARLTMRPTYLPFPAGYGPTANSMFANGLSDSGAVVGGILGDDGSGNSSFVAGFLYVHGHTYDLNAFLPPHSGWQILDAVGINDRGEIVGTGNFKGEFSAPFVMKPLGPG